MRRRISRNQFWSWKRKESQNSNFKQLSVKKVGEVVFSLPRIIRSLDYIVIVRILLIYFPVTHLHVLRHQQGLGPGVEIIYSHYGAHGSVVPVVLGLA